MTEGQLVKPRGKMTPFAFYVFICMEEAKKEHIGKNLVFKMFEEVCLASTKITDVTESQRNDEAVVEKFGKTFTNICIQSPPNC